MKRTLHMTGYTIGITSDELGISPSANHFKTASLSPALNHEIAQRGLDRVAGNIFLSKSQKDFWMVKDGKIRRLTATEVDNGDSIAAAPGNNPSAFLDEILGDLTF